MCAKSSLAHPLFSTPLQMADGKLNGQKAFMSGKLKVKGNIMLATSEFWPRCAHTPRVLTSPPVQSSMVCSRRRRPSCKCMRFMSECVFGSAKMSMLCHYGFEECFIKQWSISSTNTLPVQQPMCMHFAFSLLLHEPFPPQTQAPFPLILSSSTSKTSVELAGMTGG